MLSSDGQACWFEMMSALGLAGTVEEAVYSWARLQVESGRENRHWCPKECRNVYKSVEADAL
jgi:hypothetical protein